MALNKCESEDKQGYVYMDGIPVKISEKYKPPKKISLPSGILNRLNADTSNLEYDFKLEHSMVDKMGQWRQLRKSHAENRRQRLQAEGRLHQASKAITKLNLGPPDPTRLDYGKDSVVQEPATLKKVPDIVQELQLELKDKRAAETRRKWLEQPQRPASIGATEQASKNRIGIETKQRLSPKPVSTLPNPISQLSTACQRLCHRLAEMGFPLPRVARAAEMFGDDEGRIVEFLLQVQSLEEKHYLPDRAEKALILNSYNETETIEYLDTMCQLLDLGFREEKVTQALAKFGNNRDKALDWLIS